MITYTYIIINKLLEKRIFFSLSSAMSIFLRSLYHFLVKP